MDATGIGRWPAVDQRILQTLMIPLAVVVLDELGDRPSEVPFTLRDHPVETLVLDRPHKPLRVRIRVRDPIPCLHDPNPRLAEPFAHGRAPLGISIAEQHATCVRISDRERPHDLSHESFIWLPRGSEDAYAA